MDRLLLTGVAVCSAAMLSPISISSTYATFFCPRHKSSIIIADKYARPVRIVSVLNEDVWNSGGKPPHFFFYLGCRRRRGFSSIARIRVPRYAVDRGQCGSERRCRRRDQARLLTVCFGNRTRIVWHTACTFSVSTSPGISVGTCRLLSVAPTV
jgi:hypothetical protein